MFSRLTETIKNINANANDVANSERAKRLKKRLYAIGLPMAICGFVGALVCFIMVPLAGCGEDPFDVPVWKFVLPGVLMVPCAMVGGFGMMILSVSAKIAITGYTTNLIQETIGYNCPVCGETLQAEMNFCPKCGNAVKKICPSCQSENTYSSEYCSACGTKLE